jgi:ABC-type microcin C transport system duplicated ATPase subunit YejF
MISEVSMTSTSVADGHQSGPLDEGLLVVNGLTKHFPVTRGVIIRQKVGAVQAVDGVSFSIAKGQTLGLVGESATHRARFRAPGRLSFPRERGGLRPTGWDWRGDSSQTEAPGQVCQRD